MSRIGKVPVPIPSGVKVAVSGQIVNVEGKVGKLSFNCRQELTVKVEGDKVVVTRKDDSRLAKSLHGLTRTLIANMIEGCLKGYSRSLEVYGVGYGVQAAGKKFTLNVGFSHPVVFDIPASLTVEVQTPQARGENEPAKFTVKGPDKQAVGEFAARLHKVRKPEPYKGKGVRYVGEYVRRKVGKAFAGTAGAGA
ncbi:MAG: 50S ribosomal protein L6 [Planctomycetes bacterium]|nr:50S ribosomal protein L6 [Planctomycetota bacterium]